MKLYFLANERLVFIKPSEQAEMDEADRQFRETDEGQQRCFLHESP